MPTVAAHCGGPSRQTQPPRFASLGPKQHRMERGEQPPPLPIHPDVPSQPEGGKGVEEMLLPFPYPCVVSRVHWDCTRCGSAVLGGLGCVAPAPHLEPLAEEGKAPGGLQGSKACGQQPTVPAWRTQHAEAFRTPANAFEWEPASSPHPAPKPAGSWTSGRGLPIFDEAEPLLSGRQCQSILPTNSPLPTPPSAGRFRPCPPSTHLQGLHPQPGTLPLPTQPADQDGQSLVADSSKEARVTLSFFIFSARCDGCKRTTWLLGSRVSLRAERGYTVRTPSKQVPAHLRLCTRAVFLPTDK